MLIKICGIKDPETAYKAAFMGAHFIGLILAPESRRAIDPHAAKMLVDQIHKGGAKAVAVFTNQTAETITQLCNTANISYVQLHGDLSRQEHALLPHSLHRIYACSILPNGQIDPKDLVGMSHLDLKRDYLLFDGMKAGSGQTFNWNLFSYHGKFRWFLSGGLNVDNVKTALSQFNSHGIDVSSGVEDAAGNKDLQLIKEFINISRLGLGPTI